MLTFAKWTTFLFAIFISVTVANAQATRTWVSGVGDDANPCSRTAPCKTFAGAISKTAAGGEIDVLDPGGFGALTITKAITIDGGPFNAGVLVSGTNAFTVSAGANDVVILRNLDINGISGSTSSPGLTGIQFNSGAGLFVENSTIYGFGQYGINFVPNPATPATSFLSVTKTLIRQAAQGAILIKPAINGSATAAITDSKFENSKFGIRAEDRSEVTVKNSIASFNSLSGFVTVSTSGPTSPAEISLDSCVAANNGTGVGANGTAATVYMSNSTVTHNLYGIYILNGGSVLSFSNNRIMSNTTTNGAPSGPISQQ